MEREVRKVQIILDNRNTAKSTSILQLVKI